VTRAYLTVVCGIVAALLVLFAGVEALGVSVLTQPAAWLGDRPALAGVLSVGLLVADVVLPVASSAVMIANGAVFGLFVGTLLSLAGSVGAAACAFALGRRGGGLLDRLVVQADRARADAFLARWGDLAVLVSRPVPIAAETVALLAGTSPLSWSRLLLSAALGSLPPAILYAAAGAAAADAAHGALAFACVIAIAAIVFLAGRSRA
jgi:uncharacterized membrane protein YdjX (TVP38/TMEM64 family)